MTEPASMEKLLELKSQLESALAAHPEQMIIQGTLNAINGIIKKRQDALKVK